MQRRRKGDVVHFGDNGQGGREPGMRLHWEGKGRRGRAREGTEPNPSAAAGERARPPSYGKTASLSPGPVASWASPRLEPAKGNGLL